MIDARTDSLSHYETVLSLITPSGLAGVARFRNELGTWSFVLEARPTEMAAEADEHLRVLRVGRFTSIEAALGVLAADGAWVLEQPNVVHPEYRQEVLDLALREIARLPEDMAARSVDIKQMWQEVCDVR